MKYKEETRIRIHQLKDNGYTSRQIANILNISKSGVNEELNRNKKYLPRIMFFDIETAPSIAATFKRWNTNITPDSVIEEGGWMICASWKFSDENKVHSSVLSDFDAVGNCDWTVVKDLREAYDKADIIVAHNGDKFDVPLFKTRNMVNQFPPLRKIPTIDTLKLARKLKFESNKLDSLGHYLGLGRKLTTGGIKLWLDCMNGNEEALKKMKDYNVQDVLLLESVYYALLPYVDAGNVGVYFDDGKHHCPSCGTDLVKPTGKTIKNYAYEYTEYVCDICGHYSSARTANKSDNIKYQLKSSV